MDIELKLHTTTDKHYIYTMYNAGIEVCKLIKGREFLYIPVGTYHLEWEYSQEFGRRMPTLVHNTKPGKHLIQYFNKQHKLKDNYGVCILDEQGTPFRSKLMFEEILKLLKILTKYEEVLEVQIHNIFND